MTGGSSESVASDGSHEQHTRNVANVMDVMIGRERQTKAIPDTIESNFAPVEILGRSFNPVRHQVLVPSYESVPRRFEKPRSSDHLVPREIPLRSDKRSSKLLLPTPSSTSFTKNLVSSSASDSEDEPLSMATKKRKMHSPKSSIKRGYDRVSSSANNSEDETPLMVLKKRRVQESSARNRKPSVENAVLESIGGDQIRRIGDDRQQRAPSKPKLSRPRFLSDNFESTMTFFDSNGNMLFDPNYFLKPRVPLDWSFDFPTHSLTTSTQLLTNSLDYGTFSEEGTIHRSTPPKLPFLKLWDTSMERRITQHPVNVTRCADKDAKDLPLEQWIWGDMHFMDASIPGVYFYVRIHNEGPLLELHEKFGFSSKIMKVLKFTDLQAYTIRSSLINNAVHQFVAYVHFDPKATEIASEAITLKFSNKCKPEDYELLVSLLRSNLRDNSGPHSRA
ncbi:hypothetical protein SCHPADRAFT_893381 [Schizopora paradoxa]|uniref:Uncharacterized protein n=1 Tax=Schizopora paradoxa TaxID=27342 RepID=A0A0H2RBA3_9AGAM|nr:hypothetical protein SCHPADRAFT_893381 [Schizopora paradoxa]